MPKLRFDRMLADMGFGSRRDIAAAVRAGNATANGERLTRPETKLEAEGCLLGFFSEECVWKARVVLMLNKPQGVLSATEDARDKTFADLLKGRHARMGMTAAGRLDKDACGLLLLTNDGALVHKIISPASNVEKRYFARLSNPLPPGAEELFLKGITLEDGFACRPARLERAGESEVFITVTEGKFHQVKRMALAAGARVLYLKREGIGGLRLDPGLPEGEYRELAEEEVALLLARAAEPLA